MTGTTGVSHTVASCADVPLGKTLCVELQGEEILLCHTKDGFFAVNNQCSHAAARLCDGKLKGHKVFCPLHSAAFDVRDGSALSKPASKPIRSYPLLVDGDSLVVVLDE